MNPGERSEKIDVKKAYALLHRRYPQATYYLDFRTPVDLIAATILSAQCRDEVVNAATKELFSKYRTAKDYAEADPEELAGMIGSITFFRNKARYIKDAMTIIAKEHDGKVPQTVKELTGLPGVGRKTANAILQNAFGKVEGVVVDTHVIRIANRFNLTSSKNADRIEKDLMMVVPKEEWKATPHLMKNLGRDVCTAGIPRCDKCVLNDICPSSSAK